jgi:hypothetical protein
MDFLPLRGRANPCGVTRCSRSYFDARLRVDFGERGSTYSHCVPSTPAFRVVSTVAALAVALTGLLPFEHIHAAEHRQVVHRHVIGDSAAHHDALDEHGSNIDHSEHADARVVSVWWLNWTAFSLAGPVPETAQPVAEPRDRRTKLMLGTTILPTHDPPIRFTSSPAPPAVV